MPHLLNCNRNKALHWVLSIFLLGSPGITWAYSIVCYAFADNGDQLVQLDRLPVPNTNATSAPNAAGVSSIEAIALYIDGVTLYAADADTLGLLDTTTGVFNAIDGTFGSGIGTDGLIAFTDVDGLSFEPSTGILYGANRRSGAHDVLIQIDRTTGLAIPDAWGSGQDYLVIDGAGAAGTLLDVDDIAVHPINGEMYGVANLSGTDDHLITIDKLTGAIFDLGTFTRNGNQVQDIEGLSFYNDGTMYAVTGNASSPSSDRNSYFEVDHTTAQMTDIMQLTSVVGTGYSDYEALACLSGGYTDYGDDPASYSDASHVFASTQGTLYIGNDVTDSEFLTQGLDGEGDNDDENNDESSVNFSSGNGGAPWISAAVAVINDTGADAYLCAWLDVDINGVFDASDARTCQTVVDNNGSPNTVNLTWTGFTTLTGTTYARFRLCNTLDECDDPSNPPIGIEQSSATNSAIEPIPDGSGTSCVAPVQKTFTIADSFTISDLNLALNITHPYRDDFNLSLTSPAGTVVDLTTRAAIGANADNINVVFDDEATINYIDDTSNHSLPASDRPRVPLSPLSAFDGENSTGIWTLSMCDSWGNDTGIYIFATLDIFGPTTGGPATTGEVEDYKIVYDIRTTAVTIGKVDLQAVSAAEFLGSIGVSQMDNAALLAILEAWDTAIAAALAQAGRNEILQALEQYLDPDGDGLVAMFRWDTMEERGTIGFYVERSVTGESAWIRLNNGAMLPGLITAPMGGDYQLADPGATQGKEYRYRLIEQEARGTRRTYGPFMVEML